MSSVAYLVAANPSRKNNLGTLIRCASAFRVEEVVVVGASKWSTHGAHGSHKVTLLYDLSLFVCCPSPPKGCNRRWRVVTHALPSWVCAVYTSMIVNIRTLGYAAKCPNTLYFCDGCGCKHKGFSCRPKSCASSGEKRDRVATYCCWHVHTLAPLSERPWLSWRRNRCMIIAPCIGRKA